MIDDTADSFVLKRYDIPPGAVVEVFSNVDHSWYFGSYFETKHFVYVGSPGMWVLSSSNVGGEVLFDEDVPADSFRVGAPTSVRWPLFSSLSPRILMLRVENRDGGTGGFVARLAGRFSTQPPAPLPLWQRRNLTR